MIFKQFHSILKKLIYFSLIITSNYQYVYASELSLQTVAEGFFVHQGQHAGLDVPEREDIANIGFIEGENCVAVIDTGGSIKIGDDLFNSIQSQTDTPICYVINTHVHFDHLLGNKAFQKEGIIFIGHANLVNELKINEVFFLENYLDELGGKKESGLIVLPDLIVKNEMVLDLGNRKLILKAYPIAHSHSDLSVFDINTGTLWLSDLLFVDRIPVIDGSLKGWLQIMRDINTDKLGHVIPGHGKFDIDIETALARQNEYLQTLLDETRAMINEGAFLEEVIDKVGKSQTTKWQFFEQQHKRNVSRAFVELEWE